MKYAVVLQHNEEDCGAACLAAIAKYYGQFFSLNRVREVAGTGPLGTTLLNLKQGAKALLFDARGVRANLDLINNNIIPLPSIIHWQGNHWVVLYGKKRNKYIIADPAVGLRYLSQKELTQGWNNGAMLLLQPRPEFQAQSDDRHKINEFQRLKQRFWNHRHLLVEILLLNFVFGILSLTSPFFLQLLTDEVLIREDRQLLNGVIIIVFIANFFRSVLRFVQSYLVTHFAQNLELTLILDFCRSILNLPLAYYESHRSGEIASRLRDIQAINQLISQAGLLLPSQLLIALVSVTFLLLYNPKLLPVTLGVGLMMGLATYLFLQPIKKKTQQVLSLTAENQSMVIETFKGAILLKTKNAVSQFFEEFQTSFGKQANFNFQRLKLAITNITLSNFILFSGEALLLWVGSQFVFANQLTIGQLVACNLLNRNVLNFVISAIDFANQFIFVQAALQRLNDVIDATPELDSQVKPWVHLPAEAEIHCSSLTFHHPGRVELLQDFSLSLPGGKAIALVGPSGCGKSTLAKLIAGLYFPQAGNIRVGPYNLEDIALDCRRQQIILIPQEAHFWSRSILDNLSLGDSRIEFDRIVKACQIAQADDFIRHLPSKYQTILGEFGANLSGGQRQRLAIALGIVNDPPILILDESTASLDPVSETQVLNRLLSHRQGKTTILISHRPRVIRRADWLVVLDGGKIISQGCPTDLLSQSGEHLPFLSP
ncbi:peptidase domain-containing ABC transporter [Spirulina sp. CS-785/01]|uniref:peptidase domain-containing ABC transporter n=1 Tax=Spirulina sp. CS-785/01 TaxID=3021716 RepID=UPI00232FB444|nr:peptidase domain-containing ABC transporter [Spirulina sp. CS-785/01]MDB9313139.1 peptidase domain-containing ABC transporter [Spirulina sp. CS-785/01]